MSKLRRAISRANDDIHTQSVTDDTATVDETCEGQSPKGMAPAEKTLAKIHAALSVLSDQERDVVLFSFGLVSGLPVPESDLASFQNVPPATVRLRLETSLRKLAGYGGQYSRQ